MNYRGRITNSRLLASSVTMLAINCGLYSANRSIMAQANANLCNGPRRPKESTLQGRSIARARTTPRQHLLCGEHRLIVSRAARKT